MSQNDHKTHIQVRLVSLITSIFVSLASGTPYLYGVFSTQLIERCGLTATDSALVSFSANIGTGIGGFFAGLMIDKQGPQCSILVGALSVFCGYYSLYEAYQRKVDTVYLLCLPMVFVGYGSITCYFSTLKAAQHNFPNHRGLAGAFPVSAYGLSATFFSVVAASFFDGNTGGLLRFLALFTGLVTFMGSFFVRNFDNQLDCEDDCEQTMSIPNYGSSGGVRNSLGNADNWVKKTAVTTTSETVNFWERRRISLRGSISFWGIGNRSARGSTSSANSTINESRPLMNSVLVRNNSSVFDDNESTYSIRVKSNVPGSTLEVIKDISTSKLFLTYFLILTFLASVGQMYIFVVGFMVTAQSNKPAHDYINSEKAQALQVSIISIASFGGRLISGITSDFIYKKYKCQRLWVIFASCIVSLIGQICALYIDSVSSLWILSLCMGGSYGLIFGTFPAVIADKFGTTNFSTIWGFICIGPVIMFFMLNKLFGKIYDSHSVDDRNDFGEVIRVCKLGKGCYEEVFKLGAGICLFLFFLILLVIRTQRKT